MKGFALKYLFYVSLVIVFIVLGVNLTWHFFKNQPTNPQIPFVNVTYECIHLNETVISHEEFEQILYGFLTDQCTVFHAGLEDMITFEDVERMVGEVSDEIEVFRNTECEDHGIGTNNVFVNFDETKRGILITRKSKDSNIMVCEKYFATPSKKPTATSTTVPQTPTDLRAFPGAEGFGEYTVGGRGGTVYEVTNLNNAGAGSLRECIEASGPRICVFRVSGTIRLDSDLEIENPYLTIAGQTAPGDGITLSDQKLKIEDSHDVVIRFIRSRLGDTNCPDNDDAISIDDSQNIIIDHCSASWSIDETLSVAGGDSNNITVQWTIISESLRSSCHDKGNHGYGSIMGGNMVDNNGVSFHHNLYAHHDSRNPRFAGEDNRQGPILDFRNNVVYNWGMRPAYSGENQYPKINYIANYLKPGPSSSNRKYAAVHMEPTATMYIEGNYHESGTTGWDMISGGVQRATSPFPVPDITTYDSTEVFEIVLNNAGATFPKRDEVDNRIVQNVRDGTGSLINSQSQIGGWPTLNSGTAPADSDHDGMPDDWESARGLNPNSDDSAGDRDGDGYTNIEEYINSLVTMY